MRKEEEGGCSQGGSKKVFLGKACSSSWLVGEYSCERQESWELEREDGAARCSSNINLKPYIHSRHNLARF
jgi:hypothetical protein